MDSGKVLQGSLHKSELVVCALLYSLLDSCSLTSPYVNVNFYENYS